MSELLSLLPAIAALTLGGVLVLVGVVFLWGAFASVGVARASPGWPTAAGRVVRSEIRANRGANGLPGHRTLVRYEYAVGDEVYEGRDLASGEFPYRSAASAGRRLAAYPVGAAVTVRYCPEEPQLAVLEPGVSFDVLYLPVVAGLLSLGALALVAWGGGRLLRIIAG